MAKYGYLLIGLVLVIALAIAIYMRVQAKAGVKNKSWADYVLLWPLILDRDAEGRNGKLLSNREWVGWSVVLILIILAIAFT